MARATPQQMAERAEAKLKRAEAEYKLERLRAGKEALRERRRMLSVHRAAQANRFTNDWIAPTTSADGTILPDLIRLNARARQLIRDDAWAKSIQRSFRRNVVGTGITPAIDDKPYAADWQAWSSSPKVMDLERRRTFIGVQQWAIDEVVAVGECFVVRWITNDALGQKRLRLQCYEFEQLDRYKISHTDEHGNVNEVRHGIETDVNGAAVAYHFYRRHPNDVRAVGRPSPLSMESVRIPAAMVCHVYDPERARQTHGITRLAPVLTKLRDLSEYDAAQLRVARAEASIGLLIRGTDDGTDPLELDGLNVAYVGQDEEVTTFAPSRPGNTYDPFVRAQLKAIAAGVGISYDQIARDFDQGNFSSKRQTSLEDRREYEPLQLMLIGQLCTPVKDDFEFVWALRHAGATDYFLRDTPESIDWQGQGWDWVDPEAQGKGVELMYRLGLTTVTEQANLRGTTPKKIRQQAAIDGTDEIVRRLEKQGPAPAPTQDPGTPGRRVGLNRPRNRSSPMQAKAIAFKSGQALTRVQLRSALPRAVAVDRDAGVIRDVAVITAGMTRTDGLGNEPMQIDQVTLQQVAAAINAKPNGVKVRVTHPELKGDDDLPYRIGFVSVARVVGDKVLANVTFHDASDADARRIMAIAERDPESCGLSIISTSISLERNTLRVQSLDAVDFVGSPAANPAGMLSAQAKGTALMYTEEQIAYLKSLGLPEGATPEQIAEFVSKLPPEQKAAMPGGDAAMEDGGDEGGAGKKPDDAKPDATAEGAQPPANAQPAAAVASAKPDGKGKVALSGQDADPAAVAQQAIKAERERVKEVRAIAAKCGFDERWITDQIDNDRDIDEVRRIALNSLKREPADMKGTSVTVGSDLNRDTIGEAVQDAIMLRANPRATSFVRFDADGRVALSANGTPETRKPHDRARDFRGHNLLEMGRRFLVALGYRQADNMGRSALADLLMSRTRLAGALPGVYLAHSTSDFPFLLADAMGKVLRQEYALAPDTWSLWCSRGTAPDFKDIKKLQLGEAANLTLQPEGDDITYGTLTESREVYALSTYSKGIKFTRQMLINDDLSAFDRVPRMLGRAAKRNVESLAIAILTANAALADGSALFSTAHANLTTGTLSVASLGAGRAAMRTQTALGSDDPLELLPAFLIVPEALSVTAEQLVSSTVDPAKQNATPNPFSNKLQAISSPRLDATSTTQYYLAGDPRDIDTVEIGFLEGEEEPVVMEEDEFDNDCRKVKVRHDTAAKAIDYRGLVRSSGS